MEGIYFQDGVCKAVVINRVFPGRNHKNNANP
jgi:hypothetical protein